MKDDDKDESSDAPIPEEFQTQVMDMMENCNEHQLSFIRNAINKREDEMRQEKMKEDSKGKPKEYSTAEMPS
jgi:Neuraminidase (sialidase)